MYRRTRWLAVAGAILLVALVELLSDSVLDPLLPFPLDTLLVVTALASVALVGAAVAFRRLDALEATQETAGGSGESGSASPEVTGA